MIARALIVAITSLCLASPAWAVTRSWTGATSALWSEPTNWSPVGIPAAADSLIFPAGASHQIMTNDLAAGTSVGPMQFLDNYTINGNQLTLTGDLSFAAVNALIRFTCNAPLVLGTSVQFGAAIVNDYTGAIDVNGHTLTVLAYNTSLTGPLHGSGTIEVVGSGITVGSGTFSGTIRGTINLGGLLPNAALEGGGSANGTIGTLTTDQRLYLGWKDPAVTYDPHTIGTLYTQSVWLGDEVRFDLVPGGTSDRMQVHGTVNLVSGAALVVSVPNGSISAGQSYTIVDNDGSDPVIGTFAGLPQGATVTVPGGALAIRYDGGDGNDVVLSSVSTTKSWTGAVNDLWSVAGNWSPAGAPANGEALVFPASAANRIMTNDLPVATRVGAMQFLDSYTLNGNVLTLTGNLSFGAVDFVCNAPLVLESSLQFGNAITSRYNGAIDVNGQTLTVLSYNTSFHGPIDGSGVIHVDFSGISIAGSGTFSGTIDGLADITGSLPNATLAGGGSGSGTIGELMTNDFLYLGAKDPGALDDPHTIGTLHTRSVTLGANVLFDLVPGGASDVLQVSGTVTIGAGVPLSVSVPSGSVSAGQSFLIINNDGSDPVDGTFSDLPQGATLALPGGLVSISYTGGDGNDVMLTAVATTKSWTGAVSNLWSVAGNWSPAAIPTNGEALVFPSGASNTSMVNDLPAGTRVGALLFLDSYTLSGNALKLTDDWTFAEVAHFTCNAPLALDDSVRLGSAITGRYNGAIDVNGYTLTLDTANTSFHGAIDGNGTIAVDGIGARIASSGSFDGAILGIVDVGGSMPNAAVHGGLTGSGSVAEVVTTGALRPGAKDPAVTYDPHSIGTLQTKSISIEGTFSADLVPAGASDLVQVTGTVALSGALQVTVVTGSPMTGDTFRIIDNDGGDPVGGTFAGLPEGATVSQPPFSFRVSYVGGDGNDVVLTTIDGTAMQLTQNAVSSRLGETATFTARVTSRGGAPSGSVVFTDNGVTIAPVLLVNGVATLEIGDLAPGTHTIAARYDGTAVLGSSSASLSRQILRGRTICVLETESEVVYGDPLPVAVHVASIAPAFGIPAGNVVLHLPEVSAGAALDGGSASFSSILLEPGTYEMIASYAGNGQYEASESFSASLTVLPAPTSIEAKANDEKLTIAVHAEDRPDLPVTGMVRISEGNVVLAEVPIAAAPATITLPLATGGHRLTIAYQGTRHFEPSSTTVSTAKPKRRAVR
ncbi:MAG TPA: Ig-like domain-containing protein [Thermoanaerobaculia bacterium]|nr:Ig-like domain-containing protein [Thermoanaerobaculia bacterium]